MSAPTKGTGPSNKKTGWNPLGLFGMRSRKAPDMTKEPMDNAPRNPSDDDSDDAEALRSLQQDQERWTREQQDLLTARVLQAQEEDAARAAGKVVWDKPTGKLFDMLINLQSNCIVAGKENEMGIIANEVEKYINTNKALLNGNYTPPGTTQTLLKYCYEMSETFERELANSHLSGRNPWPTIAAKILTDLKANAFIQTDDGQKHLVEIDSDNNTFKLHAAEPHSTSRPDS